MKVESFIPLKILLPISSAEDKTFGMGEMHWGYFIGGHIGNYWKKSRITLQLFI